MAEEPLDKWFAAKVARLNDNLANTVDEIAQEGEDILHEYIETRGLGTTWKRARYKRGIRRTGSINGRVWTGDMNADIVNEVTKLQDAFIASFGWLRTFKKYYGQQDVGFRHPDTGEQIEGMHAMADAADYMTKRAAEKVKRVVREF